MAHSSLRNHRKLNTLMRRLQIKRYAAVGLLECLWGSAYECDSVGFTGHLAGWSDEHIAAAAEWDGEPEPFVSALVAAGFLDAGDGGYYIHDYKIWAPDYVKKRIARRCDQDGVVANDRRCDPENAVVADNGGQRRTTDADICLPKGREGKTKQPNKDKDLPPLPPYAPTELQTPRFEAVWREWLAYRQEARKPMSEATIKKQLKLLQEMGHDIAIASIEQSIRRGWQGLFEPRDDRGKARPRRDPGEYREPAAPLPRL